MSLGPAELVVIIAVAVLIFGSKRIPELARSMGQAIREFKDGVAESSEHADASSTSPGRDDHE